MARERSAMHVVFTTRNWSASGSSTRGRSGQSLPTIENEGPNRLGPHCRYHKPLPHQPIDRSWPCRPRSFHFSKQESLTCYPIILFFYVRNTQRSRQTLDCLLIEASLAKRERSQKYFTIYSWIYFVYTPYPFFFPV